MGREPEKVTRTYDREIEANHFSGDAYRPDTSLFEELEAIAIKLPIDTKSLRQEGYCVDAAYFLIQGHQLVGITARIFHSRKDNPQQSERLDIETFGYYLPKTLEDYLTTHGFEERTFER